MKWRMAIRKILIFFAMIFASIDADGILLCEMDPVHTCTSYTLIYLVDYSTVSGCSGGGSPVTTFEVWGGCGPNLGSGNYSNPVIQIPSGVQLAMVAAGRYCYCQLKSVNGVAVPYSNKWIYCHPPGSPGSCQNGCASYCAGEATYNNGFRTALFSAAGY